MEPFSVMGMIVVLIVIYLLVRAFFHWIHVVFYALLVVLLLVLFFNVSLTEVYYWLDVLLLWAL